MALERDPNHVFRDFVTAGLPSSGTWNPRKPEIRALLTEWWQTLIALVADAGGLELPNLLIRYEVTGGDENNIVAEANLPVPDGPGLALFSILTEEANTGPVTVNGKRLLTSSGSELPAGGLVDGGLYLFLDAGDTYRLLSDHASSALLVAAEQAVADAQAQVTLANTAADRSETARDVAEGYRDDAADSASSALTSKTQAELAALAAGAPLFTSEPPLGSAPSPYLLQVDAGTQVWTHDGTARTMMGWLGKVEFASPAALLSFAGHLGPDGIEVEAGGFRYKVAPSGAADEHLVTGGGIKLYVLPGDDGWYNFAAFNPPSDGTGDVLPILNKLQEIGYVINATTRYGANTYFPPGTYACSDTIHLNAKVRWRGDYTGFGETGGPEFVFPAGVAGLVVNRGNTRGPIHIGYFGFGADESQIEGIRFRGTRTATETHSNPEGFDPTKSGIWLLARAHIRNCATQFFDGHGVFAGAGHDGNPYLGNCNLFWVENIYSTRNAGDGFRAQGTDANAGTVIRINAKENGGWGVYEASFLRNYHANHHVISNHLGSYSSTNNSALYGAYAEDGAGGLAKWNGPMISCFISNVGKAPDANGPFLATRTANNFLGWQNTNGGFIAQGGNAPATNTQEVHLGTQQGSILAAYTGNSPDANYPIGGPWRINMDTDVYVRNGSSATKMCSWTGPNTSLNFGRSAPVPEAMMIPRLWVGQNNSARHHTTGSNAPTVGSWARGDIIWNSNVVAGGRSGWICTTGGVAGSTAVFKPFGAIDA